MLGGVVDRLPEDRRAKVLSLGVVRMPDEDVGLGRLRAEGRVRGREARAEVGELHGRGRGLDVRGPGHARHSTAVALGGVEKVGEDPAG